MDYAPYDPQRRGPRGDKTARVVLGLAFLGVMGLLVSAGVSLSVPQVRVWETSLTSTDKVEYVTTLEFPAPLARQISTPNGGDWLLPSSAVAIGDALYVSDEGNNRILKLDAQGNVLAVLTDSPSGRALHPVAVATDGERLAVASSLSSEIVLFDANGQATAAVNVPLASVVGATPRPIGVALLPNGGLAVADADNHRVLLLDAGGQITAAAGTGQRGSGISAFNVPGAMAVDAAGNIYVVDILNSRVVKLAPDGRYLQEFGERGQTAGTLTRPKGVAVDAEGRVYVSDSLQAVVAVFAPDGGYLGMIGRRTPGDPEGGSLFQAPAGLFIRNGVLYVVDRMNGLFEFELPGG